MLFLQINQRNKIHKLLLLLALTIGSGFLLIFPLAKPIWTDECVNIGWGKLPIGRILMGKLGSADALPLHPLMLHITRKLIGGDSLAIYRVVSAFPAVISLWYVYLIGRRFSDTTGLLALWLCALSPGILLFDRMSRYHGVTSLLCVMSCYYFIRMLENNHFSICIKYSIASFLMLISYPLPIFVILSQIILLFIYKKNIHKPYNALLCIFCSVFLFSIWFIQSLLRIDNELGNVVVEDPSIGIGVGGFIRRIGLPIYVFCLGETIYFWNFPVVFVGIVVWMVSFVSGTKALSKRMEILFPAVCILVVFLSAIATSGRLGSAQTVGSMAKRVSFVLPLFYVTCATGILSLKNRKFQAILCASVFSISGYSIRNYWLGREFLNPNYTVDWKAAISEMKIICLDKNTTIYNPMEPSLEYYVRQAYPDARVITTRELEDFVAEYQKRPTRYVWVFGRDRGDRRSVSSFERIRDYLANRYSLIYRGGVMPRSPAERYWIGQVLKREVWPTYLRFELYDLNRSSSKTK